METEVGYRFDYKFSSSLGLLEENRYVKEICIDIIREEIREESYQSKAEIKVGNAQITVFLLRPAHEAGYSTFEVLDTSVEYCWIYDFLFDSKTHNYRDSIIEQCGEDVYFMGSNIVLFHRINILPEYRGKGLCAKLTKDVYDFFSNACGIMLLQPYPLQHEHKVCTKEDEKQFKKDLKKLVTYYKSMGFKMFKEMIEDRNLMFICPAYNNEKMQSISLEDDAL